KLSRRRIAKHGWSDSASPEGKRRDDRVLRATRAEQVRLDEFAPHLIARVINGMNFRLLKRLRLLHMSVPHYRVLQILSAHDGSTLSEIAQACVVKQSTLSRVIDQMEEGKLVERRISPRDTRFVQVFLTEHGRRRFNEAWAQAYSVAEHSMR